MVKGPNGHINPGVSGQTAVSTKKFAGTPRVSTHGFWQNNKGKRVILTVRNK
jgi:hypothetical protein